MEPETTIRALEAALDAASSCLPPGQEAKARDAIADAARRYEQAGDHTVVALVGGTGSGKSSLFNALTKSDFADDGVLRPTTRRASSCSWGSSAHSLLDFLGVDRSRRMTHDGMLDQSADDDASGLVLLDLPDNDSVEEAHLKQVEQLLPVVDVLAWVVDPQKYADHLLHANYLRVMRRRSDAMVVIVNQIDTLTPEGIEAIVNDVKRLLVEDGLPDVDVLTTCALSGEGVDVLWSTITHAVASESTARRTIEAELAQVASRLLHHMGSGEATVDDDVIDEAVGEFLAASGVPAIADAVRESHHGAVAVRPQAPGRASVAAIGSTWAARATDGLPPLWADAVEARLPSVRTLHEAVSAALDSVDVPAPRSRGARVLVTIGWVLSVLAAASLIGSAVGWFAPAVGMAREVQVVLAVTAVVASGAAWGAFHWASRRAAVERERVAEQYTKDVRESVREEIRDVLVLPTAEVLTAHARSRRAFEDAAR